MKYVNLLIPCFTVFFASFVLADERTPTATFNEFVASLQKKEWSAAFPALDDASRSRLLVLLSSRAEKTQQILNAVGKKEEAKKIEVILAKQKENPNEATFFHDILDYNSGALTSDVTLEILRFKDREKLPAGKTFTFRLTDAKVIGDTASATVVATDDSSSKSRSSPVEFIRRNGKWRIRILFPEDERPKKDSAR